MRAHLIVLLAAATVSVFTLGQAAYAELLIKSTSLPSA